MKDSRGNIIFIGFKGCGKTTIGKIVAEKLKVEFIDSDTLIEDIHKKKSGEGQSFRQIFKNRGKNYFLTLEREALKNIAKMDNKIISLGGGTLFGTAKGEDLERLGTTIFIYVEKEKLYKRIMSNGLPAFFDRDNPKKSFDFLYQKRLYIYKEVSNIIIDNTETTPEEAAKKVIEQLKGYNAR